jgi:hypothetical protein
MSIPPLMAHSSNIPFSWVPAPESVPQPELPSTLQDSRCSNCPLMLKKVSQLEKKLTCLEIEQDQICKLLNRKGETKSAEFRQSPSVQSVEDNSAQSKKIKEQPPNDGWSNQIFKWFRSSAEQLFFDKDKEIIWNEKQRMWVDTSTGIQVTNQEARAYFAETWPTHIWIDD